MNTLSSIIISTVFVSAGSLVGVAALSIKINSLKRILRLFVALAAGTMLGTVFLHLLPEASELNEDSHSYLSLTMLSFIGFFFVEKILHWRHCHETECRTHEFGTMSLIGDAIHNFIDGLVIAATYTISPTLGIPTTIAIASHEIPQEIGDFAVLLYSGYSRKKAIIANVLVSLTAVVGGLIGYFIGGYNQSLMRYLLPVAAGGFLYIATSDLLPELRKENKTKNVLATFAMFILGIGIIWFLGKLHHE